MLAKNSFITARVEGMTSDGLGVCRSDGHVVFVNGAARGDVCRVKIVKPGERKSYGIIDELLIPSAHRVVPDCPAFPMCGGCVYRHISYSEELEIKRIKVEDAMMRIGGFDLAAEDVLPSPEILRYRNKSAMPVGTTGGTPVTGFYRPRTHEIIPVESCALQKLEADAAARALRGWISGTGECSVKHIVTRTGDGGAIVCMVAGSGPPKNVESLITALRRDVKNLVGVVWDSHPGEGNSIFGGASKLLWGSPYVEDSLCGMTFRISPRSFYQINRPQAERIYSRAVEYAGDFRSAADLYCGAGTLTLCLARAGGEVTGVEIVEDAVRDARVSALRNGIDVEFVCMDAAGASALRREVVTLDPPRRGLTPEAVNTVLAIGPDRVVYISCDPATLARDVRALYEGGGYRPERMTVVDMFPRTSHVETVVLLQRRDA